MKIFTLLSLFLILISFTHAQDADIIIRNGRILDGTGNSWYKADIAVKEGKIWKIGDLTHQTAIKNIDAKGLIVAPGFIDTHGHIEEGIFKRPTADNYIYDGVTTIITGNCGSSADEIGNFLTRIDSLRPSINVATLFGHNTVRRQVLKMEMRPPTAAEQTSMDSLARKAMQEGAVGFSTGLEYTPGAWATTEEIVNLAKQSALFGGLYASHIRNENHQAEAAINEAIEVGKQAALPVQISHYKITAPVNWGKGSFILSLVEKARQEGYEVTIDQYPYTASSTSMHIHIPSWALEGGQDSLVARLTEKNTRSKIAGEIMDKRIKDGRKHYDYAVVGYCSWDSTLNGMNIREINRKLGRKDKLKYEIETFLDMVAKGGAGMVYHQMSEEDVKTILKYPFSMIGADAGVPIPGVGMPHPRGYGSNARILGKYVRDEKVITLEEAIRRMTSLAAQKFKIHDRGMLREGLKADIVVFDENMIMDKATFQNPHQYSIGMKYVLVNGSVVMEEGQHLGTRSGSALRMNNKEQSR